MEVTLGGNRLGSGGKETIHMRNYERSTHDLSYIWRSTMAAGTLVPFMKTVALPGDTFDIDLDCDVLTHPTIGPLFGSYKVQLDVFQIPIRLYQGKLHMNMLGIGMQMNTIKLPVIRVETSQLTPNADLDNQQINPSHILRYLGISGNGHDPALTTGESLYRDYNAVPYLGYWDIYKNYYANKQEELGAVIHKRIDTTPITLQGAALFKSTPELTIPTTNVPPFTYQPTITDSKTYMPLVIDGDVNDFDPAKVEIFYKTKEGSQGMDNGDVLFTDWYIVNDTTVHLINIASHMQGDKLQYGAVYYNNVYDTITLNPDTQPKVHFFPLENIDLMRTAILQATGNTTAFAITQASPEPYNLCIQSAMDPSGVLKFSTNQNQEGLALKTYQSDLFNNWISTEWIDGTDGISNITAIDTSDGKFTIDELNLSKKIYDMLNRIALSGGTYDDWLDAVYTHERQRSTESPIYLGGLIKELVFQEVISNTQTEDQPLGTLAGRGRLSNKHKGGKIIAKIDEPSYIMAIISLTPRIDYSQGNDWDVNLRTLDDFHKPALDAIGFQDLITEQMAFWDTTSDKDNTEVQTYKSAGKQPAWINYMTAINQVKGNFADQNQQMFMTLNRRYEYDYDLTAKTFTIKDLTTYIDPVKFNHIFADTRRDAQNFWVQIAINNTVRRKMSAKIIPNL